MLTLPKSITIDGVRYDFQLTPRIRWNGEALDYRVAHRPHLIYVSAVVDPCQYRAMVAQVAREIRLALRAHWRAA